MNVRAKISSKGQLVLPKAVREAHGLAPGSEVEVESVGESPVPDGFILSMRWPGC